MESEKNFSWEHLEPALSPEVLGILSE
jgi:ATP-dependent RNA helicase DDX55/SPB4